MLIGEFCISWNISTVPLTGTTMCISWGIGVWLSLALLSSRALLDITSGPEVRQIFKVQAVQKPDILLPRPPISHNNNCRKKLQKIIYFLLTPICVQWPYLMRIDNLYLVGKMFKNISPDLVRSGRSCLANLGVRSCPVRKLICPVWSSPTVQ